MVLHSDPEFLVDVRLYGVSSAHCQANDGAWACPFLSWEYLLQGTLERPSPAGI